MSGRWIPVLLALMSMSGVAQAADYLYATEDVPARRWVDAEQPSSFTAAKDDRLEVLLEDPSGWVRVKRGRDLGWVPREKTTTTVPSSFASGWCPPAR